MIDSTNISRVSASELDVLLTMGGADNVITGPTVEEEARIKAEKEAADALKLQASNKQVAELAIKKKAEEAEAEKLRLKNEGKSEEEIAAMLQFGEENDGKDEEEDESGGEDKSKNIASFSILEDLIKEELFFPFEAEEGKAEKPLKDYSKKEQLELIKANIKRIREEEHEKAPVEFFDNLSPQLQIAAAYEAKGGKNLKSLFNYLAQSEETKELDIKNPEDQEKIIRKWGTSIGGLTAEEVEEEITSLKDLPGALEKKASLYKPKLDARQEEIIAKELKDQELRHKQQEAASATYRENVLNAIKPGELNGIKITPTIQGMLYNGLTKVEHPSLSGRNTNMLGYLLEQNQYVKPNPALIAEVLWLLSDQKGYREAVKAIGSTESASETLRTLKTAAAEKTTNNNQEVVRTNNIGRTKTVKKEKTNLFSRT